MNSEDRGHLAQIHQQADFLMNGKGNGISTADVVEAILWDVQLAESGRAPEALPALVEIEQKALLADNCGQPWVAEIASCPRCRKPASAHPARVEMGV